MYVCVSYCYPSLAVWISITLNITVLPLPKIYVNDLVFTRLGERSKDKEDILQEQGMQEAHLAQGNAVQERQR
jgi:hypothetical protein